MPQETLELPFRKPKYRDLKAALRACVYGNPKDAGYIAADAGIDPSVISRWLSDNADDKRGQWINQFVPLLIAMGDKGIEVYDYIGQELRAAQERDHEADKAKAARMVLELGPDLLKAIQLLATDSQKKPGA